MKVESVYPTLLLGVSQQAPAVRLEGQMAEQTNMIPDPVLGLTRRPGSIQQARAEGAPATLAALATMRQHELKYNNTDYLICAPTVGYAAMGQPFLVYNLTAKQFMSVVYDPADVGVQALTASGLSAITSIGKYVFAASNDGRMAVDSTQVWGEDGTGLFGKAAVWVRAGVYSRTIQVTVTKADDSEVTLEYTTPSSAYDGELDTSAVPVFAADPAGGTLTDTEAAYVVPTSEGASTGRHELNWWQWSPSALSVRRNGVALTNVHPAVPNGVTEYAWNSADPHYILFDFHTPNIPLSVTYTHAKTVVNPNYTKIVSDITNEYNTRLTQWIGEAADNIRPAAIADQLRLLAVAAGLSATASEGHVFFEGVKQVTVDDGGDGSLVLAVANSIQDVSDLTKKHWVGKTVRIRPVSSNEAFYMKARAAVDGETGWADVEWIEGTATEHTLRDGLIYGTPNGSAFYVASSAAKLAALLPGTHPSYTPSAAGDRDTSPLPYFVGRKIDYLGIFQDRLLVGSGAVIRASKIGEYLNFFRSSVLTVAADDTLEMLSQGTDDDTIRYGVLYNRSLVLFGRRQYIINGGTPLTPTSAIMPVLSSHAGAEHPVASGGFVFYAKKNKTGSGVHQLQPGRNSDEAESFPISAQLSNYIPPNIVGASDVPSPSLLMLRAQGAPHALFVYKYLDTPEGRIQGAWYRWEYAAQCGTLLAAHSTDDGVLLLWHRGNDWVADVQPVNLEDATYPYLDSLVPYGPSAQGSHVAYSSESPQYLFGEPLADAQDLIDLYGSTGLWAGWLSPAHFTPSPVYARDRNGKARLSGRLVVTNVFIGTSNSAGFFVELTDSEREDVVTQDYPPEIEGLADPDTIALTSERIPVGIGCENDKYTLRVYARDWLPLTVTSVEWVGQLFNNTMRM